MNKQQYQKRNARFWLQLKTVKSDVDAFKYKKNIRLTVCCRGISKLSYGMVLVTKCKILTRTFLLFNNSEKMSEKKTEYYLLRNVFKCEGANIQRSAWQLLITRSYFKRWEKKRTQFRPPANLNHHKYMHCLFSSRTKCQGLRRTQKP